MYISNPPHFNSAKVWPSLPQKSIRITTTCVLCVLPPVGEYREPPEHVLVIFHIHNITSDIMTSDEEETPYELERRARIARNKRKLDSLQVRTPAATTIS